MTQVRFLPPQLFRAVGDWAVGCRQKRCRSVSSSHSLQPTSPQSAPEVIRTGEEPVSKTGGKLGSFVGSTPTASALSTTQTHVPLAERQRHRASNPDRRVRLSQGILDSRAIQQRVGSSAAEQVLVRHSRVGSSPTRPSETTHHAG